VNPNCLPGTSIEIVRERADRGQVRHALLDFDGTLSLLREGWQAVMVPLMVEKLRETPAGRNDPDIETTVRNYVAASTGRQTIYQMVWLAGEVARRGGEARDPQEYKKEYLRRLGERIRGRREAAESGAASPESFLVAGARAFVEGLRARGATLYCASGTDGPDVLREAALLDMARYFEGRIWGAQPDYETFSKKMVVERIIAVNKLSGPELLVVGDGFVEIEEGRAAGGLTLGAATDEAERAGIDEAKRERLIAAGADMIIPDFREGERVLAYLWNE